MSHRAAHPFRLLALVLTALLAMGAFQAPAQAATTRTLTVAAKPTAGVVGTKVTFAGTLTKSPKGSAVSIQRKVGKKWVAAKAAKTSNAAGAYKARVTLPTARGTYSFRAVAAAKGALKAATSPVIKVSALTQTVVTWPKSMPISRTVTAGATATFAGSVKPFVKDTVVTLQRLAPGNKWVGAGATAKVTAKGTFSAKVIVKNSSIYRISVPRAGLNSPAVSPSRSVIANPKIATSTLPNGAQGNPYNQSVKQVGSSAGTWKVTPALPAGLSLNATTGAITGTPTGTSSKSYAFTFAQPGLVTASKSISLTVTNPVPPTISTLALPPGDQDVAYSTTLTATGNPPGTWTAAPMPAGLSFNASTHVISGIPTVAGTTQVVIGFTQTSTGLSATKTLPLVIAAPPPPPAPVILTDHLPDGKFLTAYSATLRVSGGVAGTWSATGLGSGLGLNAATGVISGNPFNLTPTTLNLVVGFKETSTGTDAPTVQLTIKLSNSNPNHVTVSAGGRSNCRIADDQTLSCWGAQDAGQLGNGAAPGDQNPVRNPDAVTGSGWTSVSESPGSLPGHTRGCGIIAAVAYCWGDDSAGQLGDGNNGVTRSVPGPVNGGAIWSSIVAGGDHTCGITTTGGLWCWGDFDAKLGLGGSDVSDRPVPNRVGTDSDWKQVTAGLDATCAIKATGTLWCWGRNVRGQLGLGDKVDRIVPVQVGTDANWAGVSNAASGFTCAIRTTGTLWCWGPETNGQLANGNTVNDPDNDVLTPAQVGALTDWASVSTANGHACATTTAGQLRCWGLNSNGQLGDNSQTTRSAPVQIGASDWESVSVGGDHSCAVKTSGVVFCWGSNSNGQLGITDGPGATPFSKVPVAVIG